MPTSLTKTAEKSTENVVSYRCNKAPYVQKLPTKINTNGI
jgi:hypothetical protein